MNYIGHRAFMFALAALALSGWACCGSCEPPPQQGAPSSATPAAGTPADEPELELFMPAPGGVAITQTTPETGNGAYPVFAWQPVEGAARYMLFVFHEAGGGYWSWEGAATSVMLGGFDAPPPPTADGPRLTGPMTWAVVALDADDNFIASSPLRPVAP